MKYYYLVALDPRELYINETYKYIVIPITGFQAFKNTGMLKQYCFENAKQAYAVKFKLNKANEAKSSS